MDAWKWDSKGIQQAPERYAQLHNYNSHSPSLLDGGSMQVHITSTPTSRFPWQGSALSPCPCASLRQHQHYGLESSPARCGKEPPWIPVPAMLGSTLVPQSRINHRFHHLRVTLKPLQILPSSLLFEAFKNDS